MLIGYIMLNTGVYILSSKKNPPLPSKFFPVFVDFFRSFKLHKGILTCVLSLFSFFLLPPPLFSSFFQVFQILPYFSIWTKKPPPPGGWMARIYIPGSIPTRYLPNDPNQWLGSQPMIPDSGCFSWFSSPVAVQATALLISSVRD